MENKEKRNLIAMDAHFRNAGSHKTSKKDKNNRSREKYKNSLISRDYKNYEPDE